MTTATTPPTAAAPATRAADASIPTDDSGPAPTGPARFPLSDVDEAMHLLDGGAWSTSVHIEVRAHGPLDADRLREALLTATDHHPMLRARMEPAGFADRRLTWHVAPALSDVPLTIGRADDDAAMDRLRAAVLSRRIPLDAAPGFAAWLVRRPGGDSVLLNVNHAIADGIGCLRSMASTVRAYARLDDPRARFHPVEARVAAGPPRGVADWLGRASGLGTTVLRSGLPAAELAASGGAGRSGRGSYVVRTVEAPVAPVLVARERLGASVNDLLLAALHQAIGSWNDQNNSDTDRIAVLMPVNLRPKDWWHDVVANFAGMASVDTRASQRATPAGTLRAVAQDAERVRRNGAVGLLDLVEGNRYLPVGLKRGLPVLTELLGRRLGGTAVLSNLGPVPGLTPQERWSFGPGLDVREVLFSPPAQSPIALAVGASTYDGTLRLVLRGCADRVDEAALAAFSDELLHHLATFTSDPLGA